MNMSKLTKTKYQSMYLLKNKQNALIVQTVAIKNTRKVIANIPNLSGQQQQNIRPLLSTH